MAGVVGAVLVLCSVCIAQDALAQLTAVPASVSVTVEQGEEVERTVTLTNAGAEPLVFCLSFERPLQRTSSAARLSGDVLGGACGPYGEVLALADREAAPVTFWDPYGLTMTPDGRLFAAEYSNFPLQTYELTPELEVVRAFEQPEVQEVTNGAATTGVTYNADTGTLWWLNLEGGGFTIERALLLEGDLDGVPTGRRIELPVADSAPAPYETGSPVGLAYDAVRHRYHYVDFANDDVWAVDTLGTVIDGYPVRPEAYPGRALGFGLDAHPGESEGNVERTESLRFEVATNTPGLPGLRQIVVVGALGEDTAPGAEPLETPLPVPNPNAPPGVMSGEPVRSTLDPNGVLYYPWSEFQNGGIVAVRPHPLPPSWLVVEAWDGALPPGESRTLALRFRPGTRAAGEYTATLQAFTAATGEAVEVPLALTVTQEVGAEDGLSEPETSSLAVYPNPSSGSATVALTLDEVSEVRAVVYDMLGRNVTTLHAGALAAGSHEFGIRRGRAPGRGVPRPGRGRQAALHRAIHAGALSHARPRRLQHGVQYTLGGFEPGFERVADGDAAPDVPGDG